MAKNTFVENKKSNNKKKFCVVATFTAPNFSGRVGTELFAYNKAFREKASVSDRRTYLHSKDFLLNPLMERFLKEPEHGHRRFWASTLHELPENTLTKDAWAFISFCPHSVEASEFKKLKNIAGVFVPSLLHKKVCVKNAMNEEKVLVMPLAGFDKRKVTHSTNTNESEEPIEKTHRFRILVSGSPTNRKGIEEALHAYIKEFKPNEKVELVIKLTHYPNLKKNLSFEISNFKKKLGALNKMFPKVTIVANELNDEDYVALLKSADIYVYSAKTSGSGLSLKEAMSCGVPVITHEKPAKTFDLTNEVCFIVPSVPEEVSEGHLYTNSPKTNVWAIDKDQLGKAMRQGFENPKSFKVMSEKALELVRSESRWHDMAHSIINELDK